MFTGKTQNTGVTPPTKKQNISVTDLVTTIDSVCNLNEV